MRCSRPLPSRLTAHMYSTALCKQSCSFAALPVPGPLTQQNPCRVDRHQQPSFHPLCFPPCAPKASHPRPPFTPSRKCEEPVSAAGAELESLTPQSPHSFGLAVCHVFHVHCIQGVKWSQSCIVASVKPCNLLDLPGHLPWAES